MSEPKKEAGRTADSATIDWAERLKASMNQAPTESSASTHQDDELAALLRAQLGRSPSASAPVDIPDTTEFEIDEAVEDDIEDDVPWDEEEYETDSEEEMLDDEMLDDEMLDDEMLDDEMLDDEMLDDEMLDDEMLDDALEDEFDDEFAGDETEEYPEDEAEEYPEDEAEEYPEDEAEEYIEDETEEYPEDETEEYIEDETEEYPEDETEEYIEDETEEYIEDETEEYIEDETEEDPEDEPPHTFDRESTKAILDRAFDEEYAERASREFLATDAADLLRETAPAPAPRRPVPAYRRPTTEAWTDDRLNGTPLPPDVGGDRLHELARENHRLVIESMDFSELLTDGDETDPLHTHAESENDPLASLAEEARPTADESRRTASPIRPRYVPLQLGLDDISPTVIPPEPIQTDASARREELAEEDEITPPSDYTRLMEDKAEEEVALSDTALFRGLGYEEALRRSDEQMRVEQLCVEADESRAPTEGEQPTVKAEREYRGREDTDTVEADYHRTRRKNIARLILSSMGAFVGLIYDLLPTLLSVFSRATVVDTPYYAPLGLLWLALISLPFLPRLGRGIKSLLEFEPTRYSVAVAAIMVALAGNICACLVGNPYGLPLFGGAALLMLAYASLAECLATEGEYRAFAVTASGKSAYILTDETTPASVALSGMRKPGGAGASAGAPVFTVARTGRIAGYFARTQRYNPYMGRLNYFLPAVLLASIGCAGLTMALGGDLLTDVVRVFVSTYLICLPSAYAVAMVLPLLRANLHLGRKGTAVIGAAAPVDYAGHSAARLIFADGDALKALYRKDITLRGDPRSAEYSHMADVVFRMLNTPLAEDPALRDERPDHYRIEISETDEQYLRLYLVDTAAESTTEIMMGSHVALTRRGVRLPKISMEQKYKKSAGSHVLYLAFNRNFHLAYSVEYRGGRTFSRTAAALSELGYEVDIASFDPMIASDSECMTRLKRHHRLELLRPASFETIRKARSSGVIATGRSLDLIHPLNACHAMLKAYRRSHLLHWLLLPIGLSLPILAVTLGGIGLLTSGVIALWQLVGMGLSLWICLATVGRNTLTRESNKDTKHTESKTAKTPRPANPLND